MMRIALLVLSMLLSLPGWAGERVNVFAAASLKNALDAAARDFEARTGNRVTITYGATSNLARQLIQGAPGDVFLSASVAWMDELADAGLVEPGTRRTMMRNSLVVVAHDPSEAPLGALADLPARIGPNGRLATALLRAVPAGIYARQAMESAGVLGALRPTIAQADNVRVALAFVVRGDASHGIVYRTDAGAEPQLATILEIDAAMHEPIVYPGAVVRGAGAAATSFLDFLAGTDGFAPFAAEGFVAGDG